jgi:hypothetical protein
MRRCQNSSTYIAIYKLFFNAYKIYKLSKPLECIRVSSRNKVKSIALNTLILPRWSFVANIFYSYVLHLRVTSQLTSFLSDFLSFCICVLPPSNAFFSDVVFGVVLWAPNDSTSTPVVGGPTLSRRTHSLSIVLTTFCNKFLCV